MVYTHESEEEKIAMKQAEGSQAQELLQMQNWTFASLFNLITVSDTLEQALRCQEIVHLVTEKFPCRVFFIQTDETSESDFFHTEQSVRAIGDEKSRVCFEEITIESSPNELKKVPFVILPKLIPDLPVYILLGHDPTQDHVIVPALQKYATRIVFDSHSLDTIDRFSKRLLAAIQTARNDFVDIVWAKTKGWREILLRTFNDFEKIALLQKSKTIQLSYCCPSTHNPARLSLQAIYVQAWLAAQLKWNFVAVIKENGSFRINYSIQDLSLEVSLIPKDSEALEPGEIFSCEILTHNDNHFLISYEGQRSQVTVHASNPERCEMPFNLFISNYQKGSALVNEAFYQPQSEHYAAMLGVLNHPAWAQIQI